MNRSMDESFGPLALLDPFFFFAPPFFFFPPFLPLAFFAMIPDSFCLPPLATTK